MGMSESPMVFVIDDEPSVRDGLGNLLRSVGLQVQTFASAQEFLLSKVPDVPGCLVLDVRLPGLSGLELQRELARADIRLPIIFLTGYGDIRMSVRAMKAGAVDFLTKPFREQELLDAVQQAIEGHRGSRAERAEIGELRRRFRSLTRREREVMKLVVAGLLNKQIAGKLGTSEATVKLQRAQVMQKMAAQSLPDLVRMAQRLIGPAAS
jgi:FixJ family two-component response regulator